MCSDAEELRCRCWCNRAAVRQGYGLELRMGVVVEGRAASRAVVVAAIAPVTAGRCGLILMDKKGSNRAIVQQWKFGELAATEGGRWHGWKTVFAIWKESSVWMVQCNCRCVFKVWWARSLISVMAGIGCRTNCIVLMRGESEGNYSMIVARFSNLVVAIDEDGKVLVLLTQNVIDALITSGNGRVLAAPPVAVSESWLTTETQGRAATIVGGDILLNSEPGPPS
ncbi:hypothetical protein F0562_001654 [Nyssa sinensis]|uniref:Uncharacterized protein n=1 Tax=Nyssa sinensis TaxID=561372 RepID=A0A5J5C4B6_9ASTE|nr:hypothetical protein F0562_001654 [Nyssa sinensis]